MFSLNNKKTNDSPFNKIKSQNRSVSFKNEENLTILEKKDFSDKVYTREELSNSLTLEYLLIFLATNKTQESFIKLFSLKIDDRIKELIRLTIPARELVVKLNNLPEFMQRSDNSLTELKCQATEIPMSDLLRQLNKNYKVKLQTPAINTLTPEKDKPDYILEKVVKILFDMKGQLENRAININKVAHDRAVEQGLSYYMIGILNSDNLDSLEYVTYYLLPLNYMLKNSKLISNGNYQDNPRNNYYTIKIDKVTNFK